MEYSVRELPFHQAALAIRPILSAERFWADEHARMAPAALEAARAAGVFTLAAPKECGGGEATYPDVVAVYEELGYADPTIAWHAGNSTALCNQAPFLSPEARSKVFDGPAGPFGFSGVAAGVGTPVDGGYRLSGKWPMVTGALDAPWALLFGTIHEDGAVRTVNGFPDARAFIVPAADFHVEHTWEQASAMRGTGSHRVTASEAFVPEAFARSLMAPGPKLIDRPALRLPRGSESPVTNAAIVLGVTRRALDEATALAAAKVGSYDNVAYSDHPSMQRSIGSMHAGVQVLSAGMAAMAEEVWAAAVESEHIPARVRARMWATMFWTLDQCRAIVSELLTVSTSSVYTGRNPIEFALRDVHAICATMEMARNLQEEAGRVILGLEPRVPMF